MQREITGARRTDHAADRLWEVEKTLGRRLGDLIEFPIYLYIEPVNQCNARCTMCGIDFTRRRRFLDPGLFAKILKEIEPFSEHMDRVGLFLDCEPLLDPGLGNKIRALKAIGVRRTYLNSNMSLMTPRRARELIEAGLDMIYVTISSLVPERYESIHRGLRFRQVYENVTSFLRIRDRLNPGLVVRIQMILPDDLCNEARSFIEHWRSRVGRNDEVVVRRRHSWGSLVKVNESEGDRVRANQQPCIALWGTLGIHVDGSVNLCCIDTRGQVPLGNVQENTIQEIWRGQALQRIRDLHLDGCRSRIPICDGCSVWLDRRVASCPVDASR